MNTRVSRRTLLAAATGVVLSTAVAPLGCARASSIAQVDVYDRNAGEALPTYRHHGRRYVEGRPGNEYAVRIRNCTGQRVLAVLSVDGVNAISGETASPDQSGYVVEPWGYVTITGWRKSDQGVAAFYFSDPGDSYAARTGRPKDLGVIGVALFRERVRDPEPTAWSSRDDSAVPQSAPPTPAAKAQGSVAREESREGSTRGALLSAQAPSLGTGHGRGEYSPSVRVAFERASERPDDVVAIRYETRDALVALGVVPKRWNDRWPEPEPFPGRFGFVPDP